MDIDRLNKLHVRLKAERVKLCKAKDHIEVEILTYRIGKLLDLIDSIRQGE